MANLVKSNQNPKLLVLIDHEELNDRIVALFVPKEMQANYSEKDLVKQEIEFNNQYVEEGEYPFITASEVRPWDERFDRYLAVTEALNEALNSSN